jgi:hypothetical protein
VSKDEKYTNIEIDTAEMSEAKQLLLLAILNEGRLRERERIIKLLEADTCPDWTFDCCNGACAAYKSAIALIKGEENA